MLTPETTERRAPGMRLQCVFCALDVVTAAGVLAVLSIVWSRSALFMVASILLVALLAGSAACVFLDRPWARRVVRVASYYQLAMLFLAILAVVFGASYLWGMYGQVGTGAALVFLLIGAVLVEVLGLLPLFKLRALGWRETAGRLPTGMKMIPLLALASLVVLSLCVKTAVALDFQAPDSRTGADLHVLRLMSRGKTLARLQVRGDAEEATRQLAMMHRAIQQTQQQEKPFEVVDRVVARGPVLDQPLLFALSIVPGLDGIGGSIDGKTVVLLPQELITLGLLNKETPLPFVPDFKAGVRQKSVLSRLCKLAGRPPGCAVEGLHRLRTESRLRLASGREVPLVRGRPPRPEVTRASALRAARAGGDYALRSLGADGRFVYKLDPLSGRKTADPYSLPRHCGTTWFLLQLYEKTREEAYLRAAESALEFTVSRIGPCGPERLCIAQNSIVKTGTQSLALIALSEHARITGSRRWMQQIRGLANMLLALMKPDGEFQHFWNSRTDRTLRGRQFYMSGQAALALALTAGLTGEPGYRKAARAAMDFLAGPYWDFFLGNFFFLEEHWTCLAAREAWNLFGDTDHASLCVDIGRFLHHLQHPGNSAFGDYAGGVGFTPFFPPHSTPTASRAEAMIAACELAQKIGQPAGDLQEGVRLAIGFLMHNQFTAADAYLLNDPDQAIGGIAWNYLDPTIRIDTVQHACSAMLLGADFLPE